MEFCTTENIRTRAYRLVSFSLLQRRSPTVRRRWSFIVIRSAQCSLLLLKSYIHVQHGSTLCYFGQERNTVSHTDKEFESNLQTYISEYYSLAAWRFSCTSVIFLFSLSLYFRDAAILMPTLSTRSCVRSPLLLGFLEVFPSGFPRSHLAYPIRSMHRTRADGMYPYAKKILPEETQSICHIRPTALSTMILHI